MTISVMLSKLSEGMVVSLLIFAVTLLFSLPLGLLVSFGRMAKNPLIRMIFKVYISIMRGTPLMLQLMVIYFGPYYIFGIQNTPTWKNTAVAVGFILNYAAYILQKSTEVVLKLYQKGSMRLQRFWVIADHRPLCGSFFRRWSRQYFHL